MKKRMMALAALVLLALGVLAGCGKSKSEESSFAAELYAAKNPYIENTSADNDLARRVGLGDYGKFTLDVQDDTHPYTLMIRYMYLDADTDEAAMDGNMVSAAAVLLALIEDCEQVSWSYPGADGVVHSGVTTEYINETYDTDLKAAGDDEAAFSALCDRFFPDTAVGATEK